MDGLIADDSDFFRLREEFEAMILKDMRAEGYVPVLDLGPYWSTEYLSDKKQYQFMLSVYGVNVGRDRAWEIEGYSMGKKIPRITIPTKLNPSSEKLD